jgi:hypothetical protein
MNASRIYLPVEMVGATERSHMITSSAVFGSTQVMRVAQQVRMNYGMAVERKSQVARDIEARGCHVERV